MVNFVDSTVAGSRQVAPADLDAAFAATLQRSGGTMTGPLTLAADPTTALGAATKQYVDNKLVTTPVAPPPTSADPTTVVNAALAALAKSEAHFYPAPSSIDPTGVADSTAGLQASINAAAAAGGGIVVWPAGTFAISTTLTNTTSGVRIIGAGRGAMHDIAPFVQAQTLLVWHGAVGGTMMTVSPASAGTATPPGQNPGAPSGTVQKITGADVLGIALQASTDLVAHGADYGIILSSVQHSNFDLQTAEFGVAGIALSTVGVIGEAANCEGNTLETRFRQLNQRGTALQLGGSTSGNTCHNRFPVVYGYINLGVGVDFQNCDSNHFESVWIDRFRGGTGINLYFRSDAQFGGGGRCARVNTIDFYSGSVDSGSIYAEGTEAGGALTASYGNRVLLFDSANSLPHVTYGTGASFFYSLNTSPIGLRESVVGTYDGRYQLTTGIIEFWGSTPTLGAGTTSTITVPFATQRILNVSVQVAGVNAATSSPSAFNWASRPDGAVNVFDVYAPVTAIYTFSGKALAPT